MAKNEQAESEKPDTPKAESEAPENKPKAEKDGKGDQGEKGKGKPAKEDKAKPEAKGKGKAEAKPKPAETADTSKKFRRPGDGPRRGKKLRQQVKNHRQKATKEGPLPLDRAVALVKSLSRAKFDETVEVHIKLGIDPTQSDQMIRGAVSLPNGVGKSVRVVVFCQGDNVDKAKEAGADHVGSDELVQKIQKENWLDFDVAIATQDMMKQVSRLGKVLGPRGLMPSPKAGTVIPPDADIAQVVNEYKAGKLEYRSDRSGNVHAGVGKVSFDDKKLEENVEAFLAQIRAVKPSGVKGLYIRSITLAATMTPGVPVVI